MFHWEMRLARQPIRKAAYLCYNSEYLNLGAVFILYFVLIVSCVKIIKLLLRKFRHGSRLPKNQSLDERNHHQNNYTEQSKRKTDVLCKLHGYGKNLHKSFLYINYIKIALSSFCFFCLLRCCNLMNYQKNSGTMLSTTRWMRQRPVNCSKYASCWRLTCSQISAFLKWMTWRGCRIDSSSYRRQKAPW